ncbi:TIGR02444 family protein [Iodidimonas sp. SYSU 1G8]|uniref:TIGR02444 family protein n=1 Tax=Iodidimonas sp. SYSU 1G8 TaxID=3133967 RepID=UPI0031FE446F
MTAASRFWDFSVRLYGRPGVEDACLSLQDDFGADVNMVLFCLWRGPLSVAALDDALAAARPVREGCVVPLRRLRRALSRDGDEAALRRAVKAAELEAERLAQARLAATVPDDTPPDPAAARDNLALYAERLRADRTAFLAAAAPLLAAL